MKPIKGGAQKLQTIIVVEVVMLIVIVEMVLAGQ